MLIETAYQEKSLAVYPGAGLGGGNRGRQSRYDNAGSTAYGFVADNHVDHHHAIYSIINAAIKREKVPNFLEEFIFSNFLLRISSRLFCLPKNKQFYAKTNLLSDASDLSLESRMFDYKLPLFELYTDFGVADPAGYDEAEGNTFT